MDLDRDKLVAELKALRRRRGARDDSVRRLVGPQVRQMCGIDPYDTPARIRRKLAVTVRRLMQAHEGKLVVLLLAVLGLHQEAQQSTLEARLAWLAGQRDWFGAERTVRRRADEAMVLLADAAVAAAQTSAIASPTGFVVETLRVALSFVADRPKIREDRVIRVTDERLPVIRRRFGLLKPLPGQEQEPKFDIDVLYGGRLLNLERQGDVVTYYIAPPDPLKRDDSHPFGVEHDIPAGQPMAPHYVIQPDTEFEFFAITVRFDECKLPVRVWRVDGVLGQQVDCYLPGTEELLPDRSGAVRASFQEFREGPQCYGIAWAWE